MLRMFKIHLNKLFSFSYLVVYLSWLSNAHILYLLAYIFVSNLIDLKLRNLLAYYTNSSR